MILKIILDIILIIVEFIAKIQTAQFPQIGLQGYILEFFDLLADYYQVAINALYFIFGDALPIMLTFATALIGYKYIFFPIVVIIRRVFIHGGDN